jgi:predicted Zn-ribbon and HTH transcriptional regulator
MFEIKCKKCGTKYDSPLPNLIMEDCPICKALDKIVKEMLP